MSQAAPGGLSTASFNGLLVISVIAVTPVFAASVKRVAVALGRADRNLRLDAFLTRLQDTTAEIRVRIAVTLFRRRDHGEHAESFLLRQLRERR